MLKEAIESSIVKNGLEQFFQTQKFLYYKNNTSYADIAIDLNTLTKDIEKYRKELVVSQTLINELKKENEFLKNANIEMTQRKEKIIKTLDIGIKELEEAKERVNILEKEKQELNEGIMQLQVNFDNLKVENRDLNENYEKDMVTTNNRICELSTKVFLFHTLTIDIFL